MTRIQKLLLDVGLMVSTAAAIAYAVLILVGIVLHARWFWGGALAAFAGPVCFALAIYLNERRNDAGTPHA